MANFSGFIQGTPILLCTKPSHSHRNEILMGYKINIFIIQASENSQHIWNYTFNEFFFNVQFNLFKFNSSHQNLLLGTLNLQNANYPRELVYISAT